MNPREFFTKKWIVILFFGLVFIYAWYFAAPVSAILIAIAGNIFLGYVLSAPKYKGAPTNNFDGKKFHNPTGVKASGFVPLIKWLFNRKRTPWETRNNFAYGAKPKERVNSGTRITF